MSTPLKSNDSDELHIPDGTGSRIGLVVAEWNRDITQKLESGALELLHKSGMKPENLFHLMVPGSFELVAGAQIILENRGVDAVICLGCVIRGETAHFDYICQAVSNGIMNLSLKYNKPVVFGVLTTENLIQAEDRSGGKYGNKGEESALTALKMIEVKKSILRSKNSNMGFV